MRSQSLEGISLKSGNFTDLTPLEEFDTEELDRAVVISRDNETGNDKLTRIKFEADESLPEHKRMPLIRILGGEAISLLSARVEGRDINIFPVSFPRPHLAYREVEITAHDKDS